MIRKRKEKCILGVLLTVSVACNIYGCGSKDNVDPLENVVVEEAAPTTGGQSSVAQEVPQNAQAGEDLDVVEPSAADDKWYMQGTIYTDDNGHKLEVFFDDEGMLEFAIDGLSMYFSTVDNYQLENDWRIYTCDDGTVIIYYPGSPAHLEISDGEYAGLYEAGSDKAE